MTNNFAWANPKIKSIQSLEANYITHITNVYTGIKSLAPSDYTFNNVILALDSASGHYHDDLLKVHLMTQVHPNKNLRDVCKQVELSITNKLVDIEYDAGVYKVLKSYIEGNYKKEKKNLSKEDIKLADDYYKYYQRMGFDLDAKKQKELKAIIKKHNDLSQKFRLNINNYQDYILCSLDDLAGLSRDFIQSLPKVGENYKVTLDYPHIGPFLANATNRELRKKLSIKNSQKGGKQNLDILKKLIDLRIKKATMLGYKNYTDYKLADKMAKDSITVNNFVNDLIAKLMPASKKDLVVIENHAKKLGISKLEDCDTAYVANKLKQDIYGQDEETLRSYFETNHVIKTMFDTFSSLLSIDFKTQNTTLWHKDAAHVRVIDKKTKKFIAHLMLDLYPRENKYSHAAAFDTQYNGEKIVTLVCNFRKPMLKGKNKIFSTMTMREVETMYHEFGHALHFMLYNKKHATQNGFRVAWDFVEMPSQILENFIWNEKALQKLSRHVITGKSLSKNEIKNILAGRKFLEASGTMRQLVQTRLDLDIHTGKIKSYNAHHIQLTKKLIGIQPPKESLFPAGFGHMEGYDSLYYSYLWALVYAEDFFSIFENHGVTNKKIGMRYRQEVLEIGAARSETDTAKAFLGRRPNNKAFLKGLGL
jgi:thimet oligopeptidase